MKCSTIPLASLLTLFVGCQGSPPEPSSSGVVSAPPLAPAAAGDESCAAGAQQALDAIDRRAPVPLLPRMAHHQKQNMRDHLVAVQEIVTAMATDDFAAIERAAGRIGFSEQMGQMCSHMGAGAPGFTDLALNFHHTADTIAAAARQGDRAAVTTALGSTLQTCTGCHAAYRQSVVDEETWSRATSTPPPTEHGQ